LAIRAGLATAAAIAVGRLVRLDDPVYALLAVALVTDLSPEDTRRRGLARFAGTVLGAVMGALISQVVPSNALSIGFGVLAAMFLSHLFRIPEGARVAAVVSGVILISHSADPWRYGVHRLAETTLGIVMAVAVSYVPRWLPARSGDPGGHRAP